jgi:hypothetical protein
MIKSAALTLVEERDRLAPRHRSHGNHPWNPEERQPCGEPGKLTFLWSSYCLSRGTPDIADCLAFRRPERPWLLTIWEPLQTKAPGPHLTLAYCCYINTVIFYHRPYIGGFSRPWQANGRWHAGDRRSFVEWDKLETRLTWDDQLRFEGDEFEKGGGRVMWCRRRWWMCHGARRKAAA